MIKFLIISGSTLLSVFLAFPKVSYSQNIPQTALVVLVDTTASIYHNNEFLDALDSIRQATQRLLIREWHPPIAIFWSTIGAENNMVSPCGSAMQYEPSLNSKRRKDPTSLDTSSLPLWLDACTRRIKSAKLDQYTDISGAVAHAVEFGKRIQGLKVIIILSDFEEDLPPSRKTSDIKMDSERIVMIYQQSRSDNNDRNQLLKRISEWSERFSKAGAKDVCPIPVKGLLPSSVLSCLQ